VEEEQADLHQRAELLAAAGMAVLERSLFTVLMQHLFRRACLSLLALEALAGQVVSMQMAETGVMLVIARSTRWPLPKVEAAGAAVITPSHKDQLPLALTALRLVVVGRVTDTLREQE
jgi:hypothetical protein